MFYRRFATYKFPLGLYNELRPYGARDGLYMRSPFLESWTVFIPKVAYTIMEVKKLRFTYLHV